MCKHHRQRLESGTLLPCAHPGCPEGARPGGAWELHLGERRFIRQTVVVAALARRPKSISCVYVWREA